MTENDINVGTSPVFVGLDTAVTQASAIIDALREHGLVEARFKDGTVFKADPAGGGAQLARDGLLVRREEHFTTVTIRNPTSTADQAFEVLQAAEHTQVVVGAMTEGRSQPWVSQQKRKSVVKIEG
jgi:hypothetical protein